MRTEHYRAYSKKEKQNPIKTALTYKRIYQSLDCPTITETAEILGVSKGRVYQMLNLLKLDERILEYLLHDKTGENYTERQLRGLLHLPIEEQFKTIVKHHMSKQNKFSPKSLKRLRLSFKSGFIGVPSSLKNPCISLLISAFLNCIS